MKIEIYFLLFIIYSVIGWLIETTLKSVEAKHFINRGFLIGPYCPIYGCGAILIILLLKRYLDRALGLFCMSMIICTILEYFTSYLMEKLFNARWWDYSKNKYNINGRVCLNTMIPFGLMSLLMMYIINPLLILLLNKINPNTLTIISIILLIIFIIDIAISTNALTKFNGITKKEIKDNTEEISEYVRGLIMKKGFLLKRLITSYPNVKMKLRRYAQSKNFKVKTIGLLDSGLGGLTILKDVTKTYPNQKYYYYADNLNNPYGTKNKQQLLDITKKNIDYLIKQDCNLIILACGTISTNIYDDLCKLYPKIIFIKATANITNILNDNKKVLFLATLATCNSPYIKTLNKTYPNLEILPCEKLATLIEKQNKKEIDKYLKQLLINYKNINYDYVVLGCTHYPLCLDLIKKHLKFTNIYTLSKDVITNMSTYINNDNTPSLTIYNSKNNKDYEKLCFKIYNDK